MLIYFMYSGHSKEAIRCTNVTLGIVNLTARMMFYAMEPVCPGSDVLFLSALI